MAYYTALQTEWPLLTAGTTDVKLAQLNAMTVTTIASADISTGDVEAIIVPTGEMYAINVLSTKLPSGSSPPSPVDQVIACAWNVMRILNQWTTIQTSNTVIWAPTQTALAALVAAGVLSQASVTAIGALVERAEILPWWKSNGYQAPINASDLTAAGGLV